MFTNSQNIEMTLFYLPNHYKSILYPIFLFFFTPLFAQKQQVKVIQTAFTKMQKMPIVKNSRQNTPFHFFGSPSEGYQVAAKEGLFGYMNRQYAWQVPPQYDYAFAFHEGWGIVFLDGQPSYIDKKGNKPFNTDYAKDLMPFHNGRALFRTHSGKMGLLNKDGQLIGDTVFRKIYPFNSKGIGFENLNQPQNYRAATVAIRYTQANGEKDSIEKNYAIIDTNGRFRVPFGVFSHISDYENNYATATNENYTALFDASGNEVFRLAHDTTRGFYLPMPLIVKEGVFKVLFPFLSSETAHKKRDALMNLKGELILNDSTYAFIYDYDDKKAVVYAPKKDKKMLHFYNNADKLDCPELEQFPSLEILKKNGVDVAVMSVLEKPKYGIIDSCFKWQVPPQYDRIQLMKGFFCPYFILTKKISEEETKEKKIKIQNTNSSLFVEGLADSTGKMIFDAKDFRSISPSDKSFTKFQFYTIDGLELGTMDKTGKILSRKKNQFNNYITHSSHNDNKLYFREEWKIMVEDEPCNSVQQANNTCQGYQKLINPAVSKAKTAEIYFSETDTLNEKTRYNRKVIKAKLVNPTNDTLFFKTQQNQLKVTIQAQDERGQWREISIVRGLTPYEKEQKQADKQSGLPPQYFWTIDLPTYSGRIKTKCRCLIFTSNTDEKPIISPEWNASINPAQFWKTMVYNPEKLFSRFSDLFEADN